LKDHQGQTICTTSGNPIDEHTREIDPKTGMQRDYIVLCEEERAKGFVRPYRNSYRHIGQRPTYPVRTLTEEEKECYKDAGYVAFEAYPESDSITGRFWTSAQLNSGCGTVTIMGKSLSETWARSPEFYGATFCCGCKTHLPVSEFTWLDKDGKDTNERLGT
jgi:hypothetical protein